jgi:large subunit ribosomal protein L10
LNREQKAAVIERVATEIQESGAIFAVDYRGLSVKQSVELRTALRDAEASFQVVKNTLTQRAADQAGAESLKPLLVGPTAFTFVRGDVALAAKALARFRRETGLLEWKGGQMDGEPLTPDEIESIARLPAREQLHAQLVGVVASPITGLVRGLASLISGLAIQLEQIREQGLVGGGEEPAAESTPPAEAEAPAAEEAPATEAEEAPATEAEEAPAEETPSEAPGDPVAEAEAAESDATSESEDSTPSEGEAKTETQEG